MNKAAKIIMQQLENEGVTLEKDFGINWLMFKHNRDSICFAFDQDLPKAIDFALKRGIRITGLLSKLQDALHAESEGTLDELLFKDDEKVGG